jgi:hypothetical protein
MQLFSNKTLKYFSGIHWFDRKEIRDVEALTQGDITYIKGWSISSFGYGNVVYLISRRVPDILIVTVITSLYFHVTDMFIDPEASRTGLFLLLDLLMSIAGIYTLFFTLRHGRRLSWNRGRYFYTWSNFMDPELRQFESVEDLRTSEKKYNKYSAIPSLVITVIMLSMLAWINLS